MLGMRKINSDALFILHHFFKVVFCLNSNWFCAKSCTVQGRENQNNLKTLLFFTCISVKMVGISFCLLVSPRIVLNKDKPHPSLEDKLPRGETRLMAV